MIERPHFLDQPEPDPDRQGLDPSRNHGPAESPEAIKLSKPVLFEHDPEGPEDLPPVIPISVVAERSFSFGTVTLVLFAAALLFFTWLIVSVVSFVIHQYRFEHYTGIAAGAVMTVALLILLWVIGREIRSWWSLGEIEKLRRIISSPISSHRAVSNAALEWIDRLSGSLEDTGAVKAVIKSSDTSDEIRAYLRTHVVTTLNEQVDRLAQRAILQTGAVTAVNPHVAWDGLVIFVRSIILIRSIARLFGIRPSLASTILLVRHVLITAAVTSVALSAGTRFVDALVKNTIVVREVIEAAGIGLGEAGRIWALARLTAIACCPVPEK